MAYEIPSHELGWLVDDWVLNGPEDSELVLLGSVLNGEISNALSWLPQAVYRSVAAFYVPGEQPHEGEYMVITDDGDGNPIRSWNVAERLIVAGSSEGSYVIPGFESRDDVTVSRDPFQIVGGLGSVGLESYDVVAYTLAIKASRSNG